MTTPKSEVRTFITALTLAGERPRTIQCQCSIPPIAFGLDDDSNMLSAWLSSLGAYNGLRGLELNLVSYVDEPDLREQRNSRGCSHHF